MCVNIVTVNQGNLILAVKGEFVTAGVCHCNGRYCSLKTYFSIENAAFLDFLGNIT